MTERSDQERAKEELRELTSVWEERERSYDVTDSGGVAGEQRTLVRDAARTFFHNRVAVVSLAILVGMILMSIFVPFVDNSNLEKVDYKLGNKPVSIEHPLGTTPNGKDMWKQIWVGGRVSLSIAFAVALVILLIGVVYGVISGYFGGRVDVIMMRFLDSLYGLPYIPFAILVITLARENFPDASPLIYMVPALSLTTWFTSARIMRGQVLSLRNNEFIVSAVASGAGRIRIMVWHLIPNTIGIMLIAIFLEVPAAILGEATLSFLGLGVQPPNTSWGSLANAGYQYFNTIPILVWVPGLLIAITVLTTNTIANALRDALDPQARRR